MKKRQLALTLGLIITGLVILFSSCKKINEATELGGDLIPPIDNINTFDTLLDVEAYNDMFTLGGTDPLKEDSLRSSYADEFWLGRIDPGADPFFGGTEAEMYFELKPDAYKYTFSNRPDSLHIDSVVLVLDYVETYGDTLTSQTIQVNEIAQSSDFRVDTSYLFRRNNNITPGALLGSKIVLPASLKDSVKAFQDTTSYQLRIPLSNSFGQTLLSYDTTGSTGAYSSDSVFRTFFKGFALKSTGGKAIMGFNLSGTNTKLAIYYRDDNGDNPKQDTLVAYFRFKSPASYGASGSAAHNYIKRDYTGTPLLAAQGGTTPDPVIYLQNTPGTFATIKIPGLAGLSNRIIHRAELIAEQVYHSSDSLFYPASYLFLDAYVPSVPDYMTMPYDLIYDATSGFNFSNFGIAPFYKSDGAGNVVREWRFNMSRYVQHVVNGTEPAYDFRIFAPFLVTDQYKLPVANSTPSPITFGVNSTLGKGRVRVAGNTSTPSVPDTNPQRMRLRIVYSKL